MSLYWMLSIVLLLSGVVMLVTKLAYHWPPLASARIRPEPNRKIRGLRLYPRVFGNMLFSGGLVFTFTVFGERWLVGPSDASWAWILLQAVGVLLVYDFFYYLLHRFAFHEWSLLRRVHVVHHRIRHPHAVDSLFLHPVENFLGLALLYSCMAAMGPLPPATFLVIVTVHSWLNILVHAGLDLPFFPFRTLSFLARKHELHHVSMKGGNYASLTPIYDRLFGTAE